MKLDLTQKKEKKMETFPQSKNGENITIEDLMQTLEDEKGFNELKKDLNALNKSKARDTLSEPLPTPVKERIERNEAYQQTTEDISKWDPVVQTIRKQEHLHFPLYEPKVVVTSSSLVSKFEPETSFEKEIDKILEENGMHEKQIKQTEELAFRELTEEEVKNRQNELLKMRNLLFYQELKAKRQKKIKSKKYRRILKKAKEKQKLTIEELYEINPELARQEEEKLEILRAKERITQRHSKNKSKFSKNAKPFNNATREAIKEQLKLRESLKRKISQVHSDEEDDEEEEEEDQQSAKQNLKSQPTLNLKETIITHKTKEDEEVEEFYDEATLKELKEKLNSDSFLSLKTKKSKTTEKKPKTASFDLFGNANEEQRKLIQEAFAFDDAVVQEFEAEKEALENPKPIEEAGLPGWGSWMGEGTQNKIVPLFPQTDEDKNKNETKRKDSELKHVIINEKRLKKAVKYTLPAVPRSFKSREQYEASQRKVIGKDWNTSVTFNKSIQPPVSVKSGILIQPLTPSSAKAYLSEKTDFDKEQKKEDEKLLKKHEKRSKKQKAHKTKKQKTH